MSVGIGFQICSLSFLEHRKGKQILALFKSHSASTRRITNDKFYYQISFLGIHNKTIHVSHSGTDDIRCGLKGSPCSTLTYAVTVRSQSNDTIAFEQYLDHKNHTFFSGKALLLDKTLNLRGTGKWDDCYFQTIRRFS